MLTAGLGTRLRPVTERFVKPAVPFLNVPLFYFPILQIEELGISSLVLNTHYKPEQIEKLAQRIPNSKFSVSFSNEPAAPLGSGGGIWKARKLLEGGGNFLVSNGDEVILPRDPKIMTRFYEEHMASGALATLLVMKHPLVGTQFGGVWADNSGRIFGFGKDRRKFSQNNTLPVGDELVGYHYVGLILFKDRIFEYLPDGESNILYDALTLAIAKGEKVQATIGEFSWYETGNPHDFLTATAAAIQLYLFGDGHDATALRDICHRFWPPNTTLKRNSDGAIVLKSASSIVDEGAVFRGFVVLGESAHAEARAKLQNTVLLPGARVFKPHLNEIIIPSI